MAIETAARLEHLEQARPRITRLAYRMLGSIQEAEDVVQDVSLKYLSLDKDVHAPEKYLGSMTVRACVDQLRSSRHTREVYVGEWLPEPVGPASEMDPDGIAERSESVSFAFLVILQSLSPLERAAFLMHDVFDYDYAEIGEVLDRSEQACRQLVSRARQHVRDRRPRFESSPGEKRRLIDGFLRASRYGDMTSLLGMLSQDAMLVVDGGGKAAAATNRIEGADAIGQIMTNVFRKLPDRVASIDEVHGELVAVLYELGHVDSVFSFEVHEGKIAGIFIQRNPDKLSHFQITAS